MGKEPKRTKEKKKSPIKTLLLIIWILLLALLAAIVIYVYPLLKNMNIDSLEENPEPTLNPSEILEESEEIPSDLPTAQPTPGHYP